MALIRKDAIKRSRIVDAEVGWEDFTALGKMGAIWDAAQEDEGRNVLRRSEILDWGRVKPEHAERFLAACCIVRKVRGDDHVHFLEPAGGDRYRLVGNLNELERIERHRAEKSAAGKASAEARKTRLGSAIPHGGYNDPNRTEIRTAVRTETEQTAEQNLEQSAEQNSNPSALALASAIPSASASQTLSSVDSPPSTLSSPPERPPDPIEPSDLAVGREWLDFAVQETPWRAGRSGMTAEAFAVSIARVRRVTGLDETGIAAVLAFVRSDDFWRQNALSPAGLLKKSGRNGLRKIDNILVRMRSTGSREQKLISGAKEWAES